jgi:hypothetical protein
MHFWVRNKGYYPIVLWRGSNFDTVSAGPFFAPCVPWRDSCHWNLAKQKRICVCTILRIDFNHCWILSLLCFWSDNTCLDVDYILWLTFHFFDKMTWGFISQVGSFMIVSLGSIALLGVSFRQFDFVLQSLCIRATFKLKVKERGKVVLSGTVRLHPRGSRLWTVLTCSSWAHKVFLTPRHFDIPEGFY